MKIPIQHILARAKHRPPGYIEEVLAAAGISMVGTRSTASPSSLPSILDLPSSTYEELCAKYRPPIPDLRALATDYAGATAAWRIAGFPVLDERSAYARADICALCAEFRLKDGKLTCRAYGCEPLKFWLEVTPCLLEKWPS
jgi:hypothetical protein